MAAEVRAAASQVIAIGGFMGTGKSTVGPLVAERLGRPFVDLDQRVEERAGRTIPDLFAHAGEPAFRQLEDGALAEILAGPPVVLALGGGTLHQPASQRRLHGVCVVVLQAPWAIVEERIAGSDRPLRDQARERFLQREAGYREVGLQIDATGSPAEVAARVVDAVRRA